MSPTIYSLQAEGIRVDLDLDIGHLARVEIERDGRRVAPFHRAPWADDPASVAGDEVPPHLAGLSGDFFCAPFAASDVEQAPAHGWPANARWQPIGSFAVDGGICARFELTREVSGARVVKEFALRDGHPFLYQRHIFEGGTGGIPVANHAMFSLPAGGRMFFSPKRWAETPATPLEEDPQRGRSIFRYPTETTDLHRLPLASGGTVDLSHYPVGEDHEDIAMLIEAEGSTLGWSAILRPEQGDMALTLKDPRQLPATVLWFSNGGRSYAPWSGRHRHVLGVEDGCTYSIAGHQASVEPNPLSRKGVPTAIELDPNGAVAVRHVVGAIPIPDWFTGVADVSLGNGSITVTALSGAAIDLPFDAAFLFGEN
jgi:hypothetical protein